ncbi:MAG: hypothetical protein GXP05_04380 [Alphaproteobacteria bacterium]|nr:hypothetical protein [Alphaproteobacteria bacterium]
MRTFDIPTQAIHSRSGVIARQMIWITAKNRTTGAPETIGFWNGADHEVVTIGGVARTYYGAGTMLNVPRIITEIGVKVRTHRITFSSIAPEVQIALRQYDARFAPIEVHRVLLDLDTRALVSEPHRVLKGQINKHPIPTKKPGDSATLTLEIVTSARALTRTLALKKSDESQQLRGGDRFRKHADIAGEVITYWGEKKL